MSATKKTLVYSTADSTIIGNSECIKNKLLNNFNIECFDPTATYTPSTHILVVDQYDHNRTGWHLPFVERGYKTIVECFWDSCKDESPTIKDQTLSIRAKEWLWITDCIMNQYSNNKQQQPLCRINPDKFFLLLMNLKRDTRDQLFEHTTPYLQDSLYSYRGRGITIAGDDPTAPASFVAQHYSNPDWYTQTNFSLVSETLPVTIPAERLFVSEKTFKPITLMHPFIIHGSRGSLAYLHELGFQTFDHVIDESYDLGTTVNDRMKSIDILLNELYQEFKQGKILFNDSESQRRIQHNYNRFYDINIVNKLWKTQVVDVIQEFIDA
jgi:hypothetical protein